MVPKPYIITASQEKLTKLFRQLLKRLLIKLHLTSFVIGLRKIFQKTKKAVKMNLGVLKTLRIFLGDTLGVAVTLRSDRVL